MEYIKNQVTRILWKVVSHLLSPTININKLKIHVKNDKVIGPQ